MASEQDLTSDSLDSSVVPVPKELLGYVKTSLVDHINKSTPEEFSANIHYTEGQLPKLEVLFGGHQPSQSPLTASDTNTIIVKNIPDSADEELLEVFFESTKKQGGGPVKSVKILADKHIAFVEFCEKSAVKTVLNKRPIKLGKTELDVQPFNPLLKGQKKIKHVRVDLAEMSDRFSDELLKKQIDRFSDELLKNQLESLGVKERARVPDYGPELFAMLKVGSRVVRGRDWVYDDQDGGPGSQGTVTKIYQVNFAVDVKWDNGKNMYYFMGYRGKYRLKLAP